MHRRKLQFAEDTGPNAVQGNQDVLRDIETKKIILCAFDKHGRCRRSCAALSVEGNSVEIHCLRLPGENIIGHLKED